MKRGKALQRIIKRITAGVFAAAVLCAATLPFTAKPVKAAVDWPLTWELDKVSVYGESSKSVTKTDGDVVSWSYGEGFYNYKYDYADGRIKADQHYTWTEPPATIPVCDESSIQMSFTASYPERTDPARPIEVDARRIYVDDEGRIEDTLDNAWCGILDQTDTSWKIEFYNSGNDLERRQGGMKNTVRWIIRRKRKNMPLTNATRSWSFALF